MKSLSRIRLPPVLSKGSSHHRPSKHRMAGWVRTLSTLRTNHKKKLDNTVTAATNSEPIDSTADISDYGEIYAGDEDLADVVNDVNDPCGAIYIGDNGSIDYAGITEENEELELEEEEDEDANCVVSDMDYIRASHSSLSTVASSLAPSLTSLPEQCRRPMWAAGNVHFPPLSYKRSGKHVSFLFIISVNIRCNAFLLPVAPLF